MGYGFASGHASITATESGARILLLEKAMKGLEGGNPRYSGRGFGVPNGDSSKTRAYFRDLRGLYDTPSDAYIDAFVNMAESDVEWLSNLGADPMTDGMWNASSCEFKELPNGMDDDHEKGPLMHIDAKTRLTPATTTSFSASSTRPRPSTYGTSTSQNTLCRIPQTKVVHGVKFEHDGKTYKVRAKNGAILIAGILEELARLIYDDTPDVTRMPNYTKSMGPNNQRFPSNIEQWNADYAAGRDTCPTSYAAGTRQRIGRHDNRSLRPQGPRTRARRSSYGLSCGEIAWCMFWPRRPS